MHDRVYARRIQQTLYPSVFLFLSSHYMINLLTSQVCFSHLWVYFLVIQCPENTISSITAGTIIIIIPMQIEMSYYFLNSFFLQNPLWTSNVDFVQDLKMSMIYCSWLFEKILKSSPLFFIMQRHVHVHDT